MASGIIAEADLQGCGMHLMFIKDVEEEIDLLKSEGYSEVKEI